MRRVAELSQSLKWELNFGTNHKSISAGSPDSLQDSLGNSSFRDYLYLLKFRSFNAKKSCHIDDLTRTYEVGGIRAESLNTGSKLAALHCFRDVQADAAGAFLGAKQAEVANNHFTFLLLLICCSRLRPIQIHP